MTDKSMHFQFGDREILMSVTDVLSSPVDIIVISNDSELSLADHYGEKLLAAAGPELSSELSQLLRQYGSIDPGMVLYTTAGQLPYEAIIHTINPLPQTGDEQRILEQSISRSLLLCETNDWRSIAFPALAVETDSVRIEICAKAFFRAITSFWDARHECVLEKINLCLTSEQLQAFFTSFRHDALDPVHEKDPALDASESDKDEQIGVIDLQEDDLNQSDEEVNSWFK